MARTLGNSRARTPLGEIQPTLFNAFLFFPVRHGCYTPRLGWIHDEPCFHETRGILNITRMRVEKSLIMVLKCARTGFTKDHWGSLRQRASSIYGRGTASIYANTKDFLPFSLIDVCFTWPAPNSFNRRAGRNKFHVRLFFPFLFYHFLFTLGRRQSLSRSRSTFASFQPREMYTRRNLLLIDRVTRLSNYHLDDGSRSRKYSSKYRWDGKGRLKSIFDSHRGNEVKRRGKSIRVRELNRLISILSILLKRIDLYFSTCIRTQVKYREARVFIEASPWNRWHWFCKSVTASAIYRGSL